MAARYIVLVGLLVALCPGAVAKASAPRHVGAGCIIKVGDGIVMVRDAWSERWSLPGGGAAADETSARTATRQTEEETGLPVRAHAHIGAAANGFRIYACTPLTGKLHLDVDGRLPLPASAWRELVEVRLLDPAALPRAAWRFPRQRAQVLAMVNATPSLTDLELDRVPAPPGLLAQELAVAHWLRALPRATPWRRIAAALGGPTALCATLVWVWFRHGMRRSAMLAYTVFGTALAGCVLRALCALPRPWHLVPALAAEAVTGYGFSGSQLLWVATAAGALALRLRQLRAYLVAAAVTFAAAVTRVAAGSHFLHDSAGALILAGIAVVAVTRVRLRPAQLGYARAAAAAAGALTILCGVNGIAQPDAVAYGAALVGLTTGLWAWPPRRVDAPPPPQALGIGLLGGVLLGSVAVASRPVEGAHLACVVHHALSYAALGLLVPATEAMCQRARAVQPARATRSQAARATRAQATRGLARELLP